MALPPVLHAGTESGSVPGYPAQGGVSERRCAASQRHQECSPRRIFSYSPSPDESLNMASYDRPGADGRYSYSYVNSPSFQRVAHDAEQAHAQQAEPDGGLSSSGYSSYSDVKPGRMSRMTLQSVHSSGRLSSLLPEVDRDSSVSEHHRRAEPSLRC